MAENYNAPSRFPGQKLVFKSPDQKERERSTSRTAKYVSWLGKRMPDKEKLNQAIYNYPEQPLDMEELRHAPLFEFGKGFPGYPPETYNYGEEPAFAPLSREEMRLLLVKIIPPAMMPFVLEKFTFDFDVVEDKDTPPPGPTVVVKDGKIKVTFYRNNFFTHGAPLSRKKSQLANSIGQDINNVLPLHGTPLSGLLKSHTENATNKLIEKRTGIVGFIDPSKIAIFMGKIISKMIDPPEKWAEMIDKKFEVTREKTDKKKKRSEKVVPNRKLEKHEKQWTDFVALAITAPEIAKQQNPEAYKYFEAQAEKFSDVTHDQKAIDKLLEKSSNGYLNFSDFKLTMDIRSEEEKAAANGVNPELAWYEQFTTFLNKGLAVFGKKIVLHVPEELLGSAPSEVDDKIVKSLVETMPEDMRDLQFGDILRSSSDFDTTARQEAKRYLYAASQAGEFAEWRIYAWLYKFSDTFRRTQGRHISESDYRDLQIIYSQSDKVGNRIGTGVLPYKPILITPEMNKDAKFYPRPLSLYTRNPDYEAEVAKKVQAKNPRAIFETIPGVIKQFEKGIGFDETFDGSDAGLKIHGGNLLDILGEPLARDVGNFMAQMQVSKISPDAKAVASEYYDNYKAMGQQYPKDVSPQHFATLEKYAEYLNRPAESYIDKLESISPEQALRSDNIQHIRERQELAESAKENNIRTIGIILAKTSHLTPDIQRDFIALLSNDTTEPGLIQEILSVRIQDLLGSNKLVAYQELRNLKHFLSQRKVRTALQLLERAIEYREKVQPAYIESFKKAAEFMASSDNKLGDIIPKDLDDKKLAKFEKYGLRLTGDEMKSIETLAMADGLKIAGVREEDNNEANAAATALGAEYTELDRNKHRASFMLEKLKKTDENTRRLIVLDMSTEALKNLDEGYLSNPKLGKTYRERYTDWLEASGRIFNLPSLRPIRQDLLAAVSLMDKPATVREGLNHKSLITERINRALNFVKYEIDTSKKGPKPKEEAEE